MMVGRSVRRSVERFMFNAQSGWYYEWQLSENKTDGKKNRRSENKNRHMHATLSDLMFSEAARFWLKTRGH